MDWKQTLGTVAPGLATMLGGPLAGMATSAIMTHFGIQSTGDPGQDDSAISKAIIGMTPADAVEIKKIEADLAVEMKKAGVDIYKIEVEDRKSARTMREKMGGDLAGDIISFAIIIGWVFINYMVISSATELPNRDLIMRALGTLDALVTCVVYFYRGSSKGSADKTALMKK